MRAAISLLVLLLSMCGVQTESNGTEFDLSTELKELRDMVVELKGRLVASESKVEALEKEIKSAPKVAFSAALRESGEGFTEAGSKDLNLVFKGVITNVGEAYSNTTGLFTAPIGGVYYFRFTVMDKLKGYMEIMMYKNGEQLMRLYEHNTDGYETYLSSGLTLQLEKGDVVNMVIPRGKSLYNNSPYRRSTFSGFLLF